MQWRKLAFWLLLPLSVISALAVFWRAWPQPRAALYRLYREQGRERTLDGLFGYQQALSERFILYYTPPDQAVSRMVLDTAEELYDSVVDQLGYRPQGRVPIVLYPNRDELRRAFGWGNGESALGVYWQGTIRLLSPNAWIQQLDSEKQRRAFRKLNPIAHELTHYVLDYMTHGNYPRWFTEGLAQRVERNVTGFLWIESTSTLNQKLYTLSDLRDRFDYLTNQPLAYRQSYLLVEYLAQTYGEESLTDLVQRLADGVPFERALEATYGETMDQLYTDWMAWVAANLEELERER